MDKQELFSKFEQDISGIELPEKFTFPFYYTPHPLAKIAADALQKHLIKTFGTPENIDAYGLGKMFGVLVVKDTDGHLGYLSAFSGKLRDCNHHPKFVPPVFDLLTQDGFYKKEEKVIMALNDELENLLNSDAYNHAIQRLKTYKEQSISEISNLKSIIKSNKNQRKEKRACAEKELNIDDFLNLKNELDRQSRKEQFQLKDLKANWETKIDKAQQNVETFKNKIAEIKTERKTKSGILQRKIFDHYRFLNANQQSENLLDIFTHTPQQKPPAGAGECAAPKMLQYAYKNNLKPIVLAEFWWGSSPKSAIRKHGQFYPSCKGKCEPILGHMLQGLDVDENPMLTNPGIGKVITTIYEDDFIAVINKPHEILSVPGKNITDSVETRMKEKYPESEGPLLVHRLDMSTSGIMLVAKTKKAHKRLQQQFIDRTIKKRYEALLDGYVLQESGTIDLPLRVDLENRPQQLVCYEYGKPAQTEWKVIERKKNKTRIHFFPITGRTHQLRVHAAHKLGLNASITGDDLYGAKGDRLHLHAAEITFTHPFSKEKLTFSVPADF